MAKVSTFKKAAISLLAVASAACFAAGSAAYAFKGEGVAVATVNSPITKIDSSAIDNKTEEFFDSNAVFRLPEEVEGNEEISVIVTLGANTLTKAYGATGCKAPFSEYISSEEANAVRSDIQRQRNDFIARLGKSGISYTAGAQYDTLLSGFEINIKASEFDSVNALLQSGEDLIVSEVYAAAAEDQIITNDVDVYDTGIFNSSTCNYQGDGVLVAVLDTGCDYTHTAFSVSNFNTSNEAFTPEVIESCLNSTNAYSLTSGLTVSDVYVSKKIPYAYDYADCDSDVAPISNQHGTHVAGIIAGVDDVICGVAPNAQLAIMKVFSDVRTGAKSSWIIAALEDCVKLKVDVINMSLGSACGFARERDRVMLNVVYDSIKESGISLITSAGNDYNATFGSKKNGSLGLTSNPDSGTVGAPSTYAASLSVASVNGVKTPYIDYKGKIIYFKEASSSSSKEKNFVEDVLKAVGGVDSYDFTYVTIPGIGRSSDYLEEREFYKNKIVLVRRGTSSFEDKVRVALVEKGAAGIIIYNNVSGDISMAVGKDVGAVCSISQDEGEMLAKEGTGILKISKYRTSGPFMSDFSSWGPTSDLQIKPEITAHGGEILSAIPGQGYDRLSGTSMAAPNQAGATALIRQYVKDSGVFGSFTQSDTTKITALVNQLSMCTADILRNKNGLPYSVRKQGAGLMNMLAATTTASYINTYSQDGKAMDKAKIEFGDDKQKSGVYQATFDICNVSNSSVSYDLDAIVMTEGVSETYTNHGGTTVTQEGRMLNGRSFEVCQVTGGALNGSSVTIASGGTAKVTVKISLSAEDKKYLDDSFKYGMYVEGYVTLKATAGTSVNLNIPMLAFYGDWTQAPIFDEEYYDTHKDEINAGLDDEDKLMADAYATRVYGGLYSDYIAVMGAYYFEQNPQSTQIAASKEHIAISNLEGRRIPAINKVRDIVAGLLRNCREVNVSIVEDSTGEEIFNVTEYNAMKSYSRGVNIYGTYIDVEFSALEHNLKNNTKYTVTATAYIDYGENADQKNARNTFTFPLFVDFEAPVVTGVTYRTEYDRSTKKTQLYADFSIYDNHYAMGAQLGQIIESTDPNYLFSMDSFGKYVIPVYSSFNSTSLVTVELTDYVSQIKNSMGVKYKADGGYVIETGNNSFIITCYDYALNCATYEIRLPDEIQSMFFERNGEEVEEIRLSPNETLAMSSVLKLYPSDMWLETLNFTSDNPEVADVINNTIIAKKSGTAVITATGKAASGNTASAAVTIKVLAPGEEGYVGGYSIPEVSRFQLNYYTTVKAFYDVSSDERKIGLTGYTYGFDNTYSLEMYPSESISLKYKANREEDEDGIEYAVLDKVHKDNLNYTLDSYFPDKTSVEFQVGNSRIASVDEDGVVTALAEGSTIITASVRFEGKSTLYSARISIKVKDPYNSQGMYLMNYKGLGGEVIVPGDRGITTIYPYAFSGYKYIEKDLEAGDIIDDEDPLLIKQWFIGDKTITKLVLPEGIEEIEEYAFANLTALEEVVLPSTLKKIGFGAFYGCKNLRKINLESAQFINKEAFYGCRLEELRLDKVVAIGNYTFAGNNIVSVVLPATAQSLGEGAFANNSRLMSLRFDAARIKMAPYVFANCPRLRSVKVNAAVIPTFAFYGCASLQNVEFGADVAVIGNYSFAGTAVSKFALARGNAHLTLENDGADVYDKSGKLVLRAPASGASSGYITITAEYVAAGAFAGNTSIIKVTAPNAKVIDAYAFADCTNLSIVDMPSLKEIGDYAFYNTKITATPNLSAVESIGEYAFASSDVTSVTIAAGAKVGDYAFYNCNSLAEVTVGDGAVIGSNAFANPIIWHTYESIEEDDRVEEMQNLLMYYYRPYTYYVKDENGEIKDALTFYRYNVDAMARTKLASVSLGNNVNIGDSAFAGNVKLASVSLGKGAVIGDYAFFNDKGLTQIDISGAIKIGKCAFSGTVTYDYMPYSYYGSVLFNRAYAYKFIEGSFTADSYANSYYSPAFITADLSSAQSVGEAAFAYNTSLISVNLGTLAEIPDYSFALCNSVSGVTLPQTVKKIGAFAFLGNSFTSLDLSGVEEVGDSAFSFCTLTSVKLKEGATVGNSTFSDNRELASVINLDKVIKIGNNAFYGCALTTVSLDAATEIGDYAFANSKLQSVTLGANLVKLGENPFYDCDIDSYAKSVSVEFNGVTVGSQSLATYEVSPSVRVIDGVLYCKVANGLVLVSYPTGRQGSNYTVEEGTVRISANAFRGSAVENVTLSSTLKAIGSKAFYNCKSLASVVFLSYEAPVLEEEFDPAYATMYNMPVAGYYESYEGLGICNYFMWNVTSNLANYYYGANFVDYVGHVNNNLVMIRPANGQNYDTFIMKQYFNSIVSGKNAASDKTLQLIKLIASISETVTQADEEIILSARRTYENLSDDQKQLVTNFVKLSQAEKDLEEIKGPAPEEEKEPEGGVSVAVACVGYALAGAALIALALVVALTLIKKKGAPKAAEEQTDAGDGEEND